MYEKKQALILTQNLDVMHTHHKYMYVCMYSSSKKIS